MGGRGRPLSSPPASVLLLGPVSSSNNKKPKSNPTVPPWARPGPCLCLSERLREGLVPVVPHPVKGNSWAAQLSVLCSAVHGLGLLIEICFDILKSCGPGPKSSSSPPPPSSGGLWTWQRRVRTHKNTCPWGDQGPHFRPCDLLIA